MAEEPRRYANTVCPYCSATLDPVPQAKKRCPACGEFIYVRSGPDRVRYLLQEGDLPTMEALWVEYGDELARGEGKRLNREAARLTAEALRSYADAGLSAVQVIGVDDPCPACAVFADQVIAIADAPPIPVPGCSNDFCRCDYVPVID